MQQVVAPAPQRARRQRRQHAACKVGSALQARVGGARIGNQGGATQREQQAATQQARCLERIERSRDVGAQRGGVGLAVLGAQQRAPQERFARLCVLWKGGEEGGRGRELGLCCSARQEMEGKTDNAAIAS